MKIKPLGDWVLIERVTKMEPDKEAYVPIEALIVNLSGTYTKDGAELPKGTRILIEPCMTQKFVQAGIEYLFVKEEGMIAVLE